MATLWIVPVAGGPTYRVCDGCGRADLLAAGVGEVNDFCWGPRLGDSNSTTPTSA